MRKLSYPVLIQFKAHRAEKVFSQVKFKIDSNISVVGDDAPKFIFRKVMSNYLVMVNGELYAENGIVVADPYAEVDDCYYNHLRQRIERKSVEFINDLLV